MGVQGLIYVVAAVIAIVIYRGITMIIDWKDENERKKLEKFYPDIIELEQKKQDLIPIQNELSDKRYSIKKEIDWLREDWDYLPEVIQKERLVKIDKLKTELWLASQEFQLHNEDFRKVCREINKIYNEFERRNKK